MTSDSGTFLCFEVGIYLLYSIFYIFEFPIIEQFKVIKDPWPWKQDQTPKNPYWKHLLKEICYIVFYMFLAKKMLIVYNMIFDAKKYLMGDVPSFMTSYVNLWLMMIVHDFYFFVSHGLLHQGVFYRWIHKKHHENVTTTVFATVHVHLIEFIIGNNFPIFITFMTLKHRIHFVDAKLYTYFYSLNAIQAHSGYSFPFDLTHLWPLENQTKYHNFHHWKNIGNYGNLVTFWDDLFGTNYYY